jgi:hypothetical protein
VLLVTIDEVLQRNPQLTEKAAAGDGGKAMVPMLRMLGASGELMLDKAYADGATQGLKPTALYRRGVANLSATLSASSRATTSASRPRPWPCSPAASRWPRRVPDRVSTRFEVDAGGFLQ